jgi:hypothetical protein
VARGFEAAVALLWEGFAGDGLTGPGIAASLGAARAAAFEGIDHLLANAVGQDPSDALRIGSRAARSDGRPGAHRRHADGAGTRIVARNARRAAGLA